MSLALQGKMHENAALTLSRYILKSIKRSDTHDSDSHEYDLLIDVVYFILSFELISREVFKVVKMMCFPECIKFCKEEKKLVHT